MATGLTKEEAVEQYVRLRKEWLLQQMAEDKGSIIHASGPKTAGMKMTLGGAEVQLPLDAYVDGYSATLLCPVGMRCPLAPVISFRRGEAVVLVDANGNLWSQTDGPFTGDEIRALVGPGFDFLITALSQ